MLRFLQVTISPIIYLIASFYYRNLTCVTLENQIRIAKTLMINLSAQMFLHYWIAPIGGSEHLSFSDIYRFGCAIVLTDVVFYCIHRSFHKNAFLWRFHSQHHKVFEPNGFAAWDASLFEHLVCNLFPVYATSILSGLSQPAAMVWYCFATWNSVKVHAQINSYHFKHHRNPNSHYGLSVGLMDRLFSK